MIRKFSFLSLFLLFVINTCETSENLDEKDLIPFQTTTFYENSDYKDSNNNDHDFESKCSDCNIDGGFLCVEGRCKNADFKENTCDFNEDCEGSSICVNQKYCSNDDDLDLISGDDSVFNMIESPYQSDDEDESSGIQYKNSVKSIKLVYELLMIFIIEFILFFM